MAKCMYPAVSWLRPPHSILPMSPRRRLSNYHSETSEECPFKLQYLEVLKQARVLLFALDLAIAAYHCGWCNMTPMQFTPSWW